MTTFEILIALGKYVILPIVGAFLGATVKGHVENKRLFSLHNTRNIYGRWKGELTFFNRQFPPENLIFDFHKNRFWHPSYWLNPKIIRGTIYAGNVLRCKGGLCAQGHLTLDYRADANEIIQFGSILFKLDGGANTLDGYLVGYFNKEFAGKISLTKQLRGDI